MIGSPSLVVDIDRCWGCGTCEVACALEKGLGPGEGLIWVSKVDGSEGSPASRRYVPVLCQQCDEALCVESCTAGAIRKDGSGLARIDADACIACGLCAEACPYGAIRLDAGEGKARKCDLCVERLESGRLPACAQHCPGRAIDVRFDGSSGGASRGPKHFWSRGRVMYASRKVESGGIGPAARKG